MIEKREEVINNPIMKVSPKRVDEILDWLDSQDESKEEKEKTWKCENCLFESNPSLFLFCG